MKFVRTAYRKEFVDLLVCERDQPVLLRMWSQENRRIKKWRTEVRHSVKHVCGFCLSATSGS